MLSLAGMSEENFKEAIIDQYNDLYWDEDLLHDMYEAVTGGERSTRFVASNSASWAIYKFGVFFPFIQSYSWMPRSLKYERLLVLQYDMY